MKFNTAGQYFHILVFDGNGKVTGQAASVDVYLAIDDGSYVALDTSGMTEIGTTGEYRLPLSQANTNGHKLSFSPRHATYSAVGDPGNVIFTTREDEILAELEAIKGSGFDEDEHSLDNIADDIVSQLAGSTITRQVGPGFDPETNSFSLVEGDDYISTQDPDRSVDFTIDERSGSIGSWSAEVGYESAAGDRTTGTATLSDNSDGTWNVKVEWPSASTATPGTYTWHLRLTDPNSKKQTIVTGNLQIANSALEADA